MIWFVSLLSVVTPQAPAFVVKNPSAAAREELVRASLPLPRGRFRRLPSVVVAGRRVPTVPLVRWPDGSLAVVQVHARIRLAPGERHRFVVGLEPADRQASADSSPAARWYLQGDLPLHTELEDPWGTVYQARLVPDETAGPGGLMRATPRVRVRRYRSLHRPLRGKCVFFGLVGYLTTFAGERRAELTLVLDNRAHTEGPVLGPARLRSFVLVVGDRHLRTRPRFIRENNLRPPRFVADTWRQPLLGPSDHLYLGDHTGKAWRFDLFLDAPGVAQAERDAARLAADHPLQPVPDTAWTRHTGAFGAHGGPAPGPDATTPAAVWMRQEWRRGAEFGPFRGFGDARDAAANGTPRNGPSALHNVLRFASGSLLHNAEGMVLQQCLRPTPGGAVRVPAGTLALRQGMSERTMRRPHGFTALDYEHFSVDLLYDYYWLTGDPLARDEIARAGRGLPAILRGASFRTCRGEGWCMQAAVLIARATGDDSVVEFVRMRFRDDVSNGLGKDRDPYVLRQPPHRLALGGGAAFDCPWQMSAFVHGAHAMFQQTGDARFAAAAVRAGGVMAGPGWLRDVGPKYLVSSTNAGRYTMPVGFGPIEGTALMQVGGFVLAEELAKKETDKELFRRRAEFILAPYEKAERGRAAMNPWFQLALDRRTRRR